MRARSRRSGHDSTHGPGVRLIGEGAEVHQEEEERAPTTDFSGRGPGLPGRKNESRGRQI